MRSKSRRTVREVTISAARTYSIGEISERTGISTHTLRFYDKEGPFVEPIKRDAAGRRTFSEKEIDWLRVGLKLHSTGMPLRDIRRYADLVRAGTETVHERFEILRAHEARVRSQLADLQDVLSTIEAKTAQYADRLDQGTADRLWVDAPEEP